MESGINTTRRSVLQALAGGAGLLAAGTRQSTGAAEPAIPAASQQTASSMAFLTPFAFNSSDIPTPNVIDVHAHFFNASDVPIRGYLEGPVANSMPNWILAGLVRALAPIADSLGIFAITAQKELAELQGMGSDFERRKLDLKGVDAELDERQHSQRKELSYAFYDFTQSPQGQEFRDAYREVMAHPSVAGSINGEPRIREIQNDSVYRAMYATENVTTEAQFREMDLVTSERFGEGVLAFVGYMMSARWSNLQTYKRAFSTGGNSVSVKKVLGALVDFDGWLNGKVRSPHADQMELHARLSQLSSGYMQPIMSYNPWTDVDNPGASLALLETAKKKGFVGAKIYPPNGFRPWGNAGLPADRRGAPTGDQIESALRAFWVSCRKWDLPVMAHAAPSMGRDNAHDLLSGPDHWADLIKADFWPDDRGPRVNLGHFGGETDHDGGSGGKGWPTGFAQKVMSQKRGELVFADLGYWQDLQCRRMNSDCTNAIARLKAALKEPVAKGTAKDRLMFGSDWLMLSKEKSWPTYARQLFKTIQSIDPSAVLGIFEGNARKLYTTL